MAKSKPTKSIRTVSVTPASPPETRFGEHDKEIIRRQNEAIVQEEKSWKVREEFRKLSDLVAGSCGAWPIHMNSIESEFKSSVNPTKSQLAQWSGYIANMRVELRREHTFLRSQINDALHRLAESLRQDDREKVWAEADKEGFFISRFSHEPDLAEERMKYDPAVQLVDSLMRTGRTDAVALQDILDSPRSQPILSRVHLLLDELLHGRLPCPAGCATTQPSGLLTTPVTTSARGAVTGTHEQDIVPQKDGPTAGRWLWWKGKRFDVPKGRAYRLIKFMWNKESADYDQLMQGVVFDDTVEPQTIRSLISLVNKVLKGTSIPWRLAPDSNSRVVTKV